MALITIKPSPLSKRMNSIIGSMEKIEEVKNNAGEKEVRTLGEYKQYRLPNSTQIERPIQFSATKKKWLIKDIENNGDELNKIVESCNFINDMTESPDFGKLIVTANIYNLLDPFFNNKRLSLRLSEGEAVLNTDIPFEELLYKGCLVNFRFQISGDQTNPTLSRRAKYIIVDKTIDKKQKENKRNLVLQLSDTWKSLTAERKKSIAIAMGKIQSEDTDSSVIEDVLWEAANDDKTTMFNGMTSQEYFFKLVESESDEVNIRSIVTTAFKKGLIRQNKEKHYEFLGEIIGKDKDQVYKFFLDKKNNPSLDKLEKSVELRK